MNKTYLYKLRCRKDIIANIFAKEILFDKKDKEMHKRLKKNKQMLNF